MTETDLAPAFDDLTVLEFAPPCGYGHDDQAGTSPRWKLPACDKAAEWALTPVCCKVPILRCTAHLTYAAKELLRIGGRCTSCLQEHNGPLALYEVFTRIERIRP